MAAAAPGKDSAASQVGLALLALGVVFGDIGTSPLYAMRTVFASTSGITVDRNTVFGVVSAIVWSLTIIVTVLYVELISRVDHDGEGGLLALLALIKRTLSPGRASAFLVGLGLFGAALFLGDSTITPAISVLSSVGGLETIDAGLKVIVVPAAVLILVGLIALQRRGSGRVGSLFAPVMAVWFGVIAAIGIAQIVRDPGILAALSPTYAASFFLQHPRDAFFSLGGVVLVITGSEALYADIGHFGRKPIVRSWLLVAFPALALSYLGEGALLLRSKSALSDPFFLSAPRWALVPLVALATLATAIASQAVISGTFTVARQAAHLDFLPRMRVIHTSTDHPNQVFIPSVNLVLGAGVLALVLSFRSASRLSAAYGLAVTGTITVSTVLYFALQVARTHRRVLLLPAAFFLLVTLTFLAANLTKIPTGGWLPVAMGVVFFTVFVTWRRGRRLTEGSYSAAEPSIDELDAHLAAGRETLRRVRGAAVFLTRDCDRIPFCLSANLKTNQVLHETTALLTIERESVPRVAPDDQIQVAEIASAHSGLFRITLRLGYQDHSSVPSLLVDALGDRFSDATYFVSTPTFRAGRGKGTWRWQKYLFLGLSRLSSDPVDMLDLPRAQTILLGEEISL